MIKHRCDDCTHSKRTFIFFGSKYCERGCDQFYWNSLLGWAFPCGCYDPKLKMIKEENK